MKKWLFISLLIVSINTFSQSSVSSANNETTTDPMKVILSITHNDPKISNTLRTSLNQMNGITVLAYCDNHALFMLLIDKTIFRDTKDFLKEVETQSPKTEKLLSIKEGDFNGFMQYCEPSNPEDAGKLKNFK